MFFFFINGVESSKMR